MRKVPLVEIHQNKSFCGEPIDFYEIISLSTSNIEKKSQNQRFELAL